MNACQKLVINILVNDEYHGEKIGKCISRLVNYWYMEKEKFQEKSIGSRKKGQLIWKGILRLENLRK